jgi:hypothetical protein
MARVVAFRNTSCLAFLVSAILPLLAPAAHAQRITGELSGTVTDTRGGMIPGACRRGESRWRAQAGAGSKGSR